VLVCNVTVAELVKVPPLGVIVGALTAAAGGDATDKAELVVAWYCLFFPVTLIVYLPTPAELEAVSFSCVEQFGVQEVGEKAAETPCGKPETEKLMERLLEPAAKVALIVVVPDDPCVTATVPVLESDKLDAWVDVAAAVRTVSEDKPTEVSELWLESACMA
jgi:hypothetical protein